MYRKIIVISAFLFLFVAIVPNIIAQETDTGTPSANPLKKQRAEIRQEMKDAIAAKKAELKTRIETIKDQRKKAVVERIDIKLSAVNEKHTSRFAKVLENLQLILNKVTVQDTTTAQTAIEEAQKAVEVQAGKTYTITITSESNLKQNVGTVTSQLRQDLVATHKLIIDAKQAIQALRKNKADKQATSSANL